LRGFQNKMLRVSGPKRAEVTGVWIKLHNVEFHNICSSPNIIIESKLTSIRWARHVACMG
jgi:hypothetical protein